MNLKQLIKNGYVQKRLAEKGFDIDRTIKEVRFSENNAEFVFPMMENGIPTYIYLSVYTDPEKDFHVIIAEQSSPNIDDCIRRYEDILSSTGDTVDYDNFEESTRGINWQLETAKMRYGIPEYTGLPKQAYNTPYRLYQEGDLVSFKDVNGVWTDAPSRLFHKFHPITFSNAELVRVLLPDDNFDGMVVASNESETDPSYDIVKEDNTYVRVHWTNLRSLQRCPKCGQSIEYQDYHIIDDYMEDCEGCIQKRLESSRIRRPHPLLAPLFV